MHRLPFVLACCLPFAALAEEADRVEVPAGNSPATGPVDAMLVLVEFTDFQCPFCGRAANTIADLSERYGKDLRVVHKNFPLPFHKNARTAAEAACAAHAQGRYERMREKLFENQRDLERGSIEQYAREIGLDMKRFRKDLDDGRYAKEVDDDIALGESVGVKGTPTFFLNGRRMVGAQPLDRFIETCDEEIVRKGGKPPAAPVAAEEAPVQAPVPAVARPSIPTVVGDVVKSAEEDLDGDGKKESIVLEPGAGGAFTLRAGGAEAAGRLDDAPDGFRLVDIDVADRYREVAVHTPGQSDDDQYSFFWYDGKVLRPMGRVERWPTIPGRGVLYSHDWMGFWSRTERRVVDGAARKLKVTPQEFYHAGVVARVKSTFPLVKSRAGGSVVAWLKPGTHATVVLADGAPVRDSLETWYLIRTSTGVLGWARLKTFSEKMELPWAD